MGDFLQLSTFKVLDIFTQAKMLSELPLLHFDVAVPMIIITSRPTFPPVLSEREVRAAAQHCADEAGNASDKTVQKCPCVFWDLRPNFLKCTVSAVDRNFALLKQ